MHAAIGGCTGDLMRFIEQEPVYLVLVYQDDIRSGIADYHGSPHYFAEHFDEARDDYTGIFSLSSVEQSIVEVANEAQAIEQRFWTAYYAGERDMPDELPRVLAEDRERYLVLQRLLDQVQRTSTSAGIQVTARFASKPSPGSALSQVFVTWLSAD
jgi:hypothetical protein